ncbi:MAG: glycan-binding surface protein [Prevotella sp.]|nr:glycan-binding surface protein [Prevotella sp.]MCH3986318.1 glycan-binding surface protein [Prevotella sp.]MCH3991582.1 glycan-binding surface protein [Prevotella sp.]MCH4018746.1 glycan-binding surface protein [Prevotella sp.]MCH4101033.1 glycan-binding surface protein [Prevotella sp.]
MKTRNIYRFTYLLLAVAGMVLASCEDQPDKFKLAGGSPEVDYIRVAADTTTYKTGGTTIGYSDLNATKASMQSVLCLVGNNLRSIKEMYFNDQKAILNTSYITDHTLFVAVPNEIPSKVTDKIYMVNKGGDTTTYDFHVIIPAPVVSSLSYEYAPAGTDVTLTGDYFVNDPSTPLAISVGNNKTPVTQIKSISKTSVTFTMPEGADEGPVSVTSIYGTTRSSFHYKESRGMLFDFDGLTGLGNHGWHNRPIATDSTTSTGNFIQFGDGTAAMPAAGDWDDADFAFEYWPGSFDTPVDYPAEGRKLTSLVDFSNWKNLALQFEMYIPSSHPWSAGAMQIIFAGIDRVTYGNTGKDVDGNTVAGPNNEFMEDDVLPRALYRPWTATGSYDTGNKWVTVTLPLATDFIYGFSGIRATGSLSPKDFTGLTIFIVGGGINGTDCKPIIRLDNIRVIPLN